MARSRVQAFVVVFFFCQDERKRIARLGAFPLLGNVVRSTAKSQRKTENDAAVFEKPNEIRRHGDRRTSSRQLQLISSLSPSEFSRCRRLVLSLTNSSDVFKSHPTSFVTKIGPLSITLRVPGRKNETANRPFKIHGFVSYPTLKYFDSSVRFLFRADKSYNLWLDRRRDLPRLFTKISSTILQYPWFKKLTLSRKPFLPSPVRTFYFFFPFFPNIV